MKILTPEVYMEDTPLTSEQSKQLLASPNAMSAFVIPLADPTSLPLSTYFPVYTDLGEFIGAVHMEQNPFNSVANIHPMLLERDRHKFTQATELAILWCLLNQITPTAHVLNDPKFAYMHNFLLSLGLLYRENCGWRIYLLDSGWQPRSFNEFRVQMR